MRPMGCALCCPLLPWFGRNQSAHQRMQCAVEARSAATKVRAVGAADACGMMCCGCWLCLLLQQLFLASFAFLTFVNNGEGCLVYRLSLGCGCCS